MGGKRRPLSWSTSIQALAPIDRPKTNKRAGALSMEEVALALHLSNLGKSNVEIAATLHCDRTTIGHILKQWVDVRPQAKARLHAAAEQLAEDALKASRIAAKSGEGHVALELLDRLDIAVKKREGSEGAAKVLIMVGQSTPAALPPALTVEATSV